MFYNQVNNIQLSEEENAMSKRNVVHIEIPAANTQAASKFYESLFGWKIFELRLPLITHHLSPPSLLLLSNNFN